MGKQVVFLFVFLFLLSFASAQTYATDSDVNIKVSCLNVNCSSQTNITIEFPNTTIAINNQPMSNGSGFTNYTFTSTETFGTYKYYTNNGFTDSFDVNYGGSTITSGQGVLYFSFFVIFLFFFVVVIFGINQLPASNTTDEEGKILSISRLKYLRTVGWLFEYFLVIALLFLSSNLAFTYLNEELFAQILFTFYQISFGASPIVVIVMMIWIFVQMFHDKQMQNLLNRGFFPQGKI